MSEKKIQWLTDQDEVKARARREKKPILIDFHSAG